MSVHTPAVPYSNFLPAGIGYGSTPSEMASKTSGARWMTGFGWLKTESRGLVKPCEAMMEERNTQSTRWRWRRNERLSR